MKTFIRWLKTKVLRHPIRFILSIPFKSFEYIMLPIWAILILDQSYRYAVIVFIIACIFTIIGNILFPYEWWEDCKEINTL